MKKTHWIHRVLDVLMAFGEDEYPSKAKKRAHNEEVEADYDCSYYNGTMSLMECEDWKDYWKYKID